MSLKVTYKNELGAVEMQGGGKNSALRITAIEGLGLVNREYVIATYTGYDGQETISSRALARTITIALEICSPGVAVLVRDIMRVIERPGVLYIEADSLKRRISCNQVQCPDAVRVLMGQISTLVVQFVCDSPFFEDYEDTVVPLYQRTKLLSTPFSLPAMFGNVVVGGAVQNQGTLPIDPVIIIYSPQKSEKTSKILLKNENTGAQLRLLYTPLENDEITVDIKNRKIFSSVSGNALKYLTEDCFLGDFVFAKGNNRLTVDVGDSEPLLFISCKYSNYYSEAVIV